MSAATQSFAASCISNRSCSQRSYWALLLHEQNTQSIYFSGKYWARTEPTWTEGIPCLVGQSLEVYMLLHLPHTLSSSCLVFLLRKRYAVFKPVPNCFFEEPRVAYVTFISVPRIRKLLVLLLWLLYHKFFQKQNISSLFLTMTWCPDMHPAPLYVQHQPWTTSLRKKKLMVPTAVHCCCILCNAVCKVYNHTK